MIVIGKIVQMNGLGDGQTTANQEPVSGISRLFGHGGWRK
jgi:hypothetical protein